jgi:tRNA pseudouridine38-40 synthase
MGKASESDGPVFRLAAQLSYRGSAYCGWQKQNTSVATVQHHVERALAFVANHPVQVHCAGRTDRGVHAAGQVIHFDTQAARRMDQWLLGVNARLPDDIRMQWFSPVPDDFHARFSALSRSYRYVIELNPNASAFFAGQAHAFRWPLDYEAMHEAMQYWVGTHDFSSFRSAMCGAKHPVRTVEHASVRRVQDFLVIDLRANAFLHHMVRNMVGALLLIGRGMQPASWAKDLLAAQDRRVAPKMAPACGLYFMTVAYSTELSPASSTPWLAFLDA